MSGLAYERLHANLVSLKLDVIGSIVDNYLELAAKEGTSMVEVLDHLLEEEVSSKNASAVDTRMKLAGFPAKKTLEDFDLSYQPSIDKAVIEELRTLRFVHNAECVCLLGPPGPVSSCTPHHHDWSHNWEASSSTSFLGTRHLAYGYA